MFTIANLLAASIMAATAAVAHEKNASHPSIVSSHGDWINPKCYWDLYANDRQLPFPGTDDLAPRGDMTVFLCLDHCHIQGHTFAGLEFGRECYCGDVRPAGHWLQPPGNATAANRCASVACPGNVNQACGGAQSLLVYELNRPKRQKDAITTVLGQ